MRLRVFRTVCIKERCFVEDVNYRIKYGRIKWREKSVILCDERIPKRLNGKFYKSVVGLTMFYGSECI